MSHNTGQVLAYFTKGFLLGVIGLSAFYYLLLFVVTKDATHPLIQFFLFQPWMSILIFGFGIQMGLFFLIRNGVSFTPEEKRDSKVAVGTGTTVSGMAMVACCAHHVVDVLPILGVSAATIFLSEYQEELLIFGILANVAGILTMIWLLTGKASLKKIIETLRSNYFWRS